MKKWKPIETAPKDKDILVKCDNFGDRSRGIHFAVVCWNEEENLFIDANLDLDDEHDLDTYGAYAYATHWMELPEPPCA